MNREATDRWWMGTWRAVLGCVAMRVPAVRVPAVRVPALRVTVVAVVLSVSPMTALADERTQPVHQFAGHVHVRGASEDDLPTALRGSMELLSAVARDLRPTRDTQTRPSHDARWAWPLAGPQAVMARFDAPPKPWLPGHRGVDLAGLEGAPVRAVADGVISYRGLINGVGVVSVQHADGVLSTYQPVLGGPPGGSVVARGAFLGTLAAAGSHCWPLSCLHLGARIQKTYLDPMLYLRLWEVSLLPNTSGD